MNQAELNKYIDEVAGIYDENRTGKFQPAELHWFLNDLMARLGSAHRFTPPEILAIFKEYDVNHDGHIDRQELNRICSKIISNQPLVQIHLYTPPPANYVYLRPVKVVKLH